MLIFWLISSDSECITLVQLAETDSVKSCRAFRNGRTKRGIMKPRRSAPRETNRQTKSHSKDSPPPKGKKEREGNLLLSSLSPLRRSNSFFTSSFVSADFFLFSEAGRWRGGPRLLRTGQWERQDPEEHCALTRGLATAQP